MMHSDRDPNAKPITLRKSYNVFCRKSLNGPAKIVATFPTCDEAETYAIARARADKRWTFTVCERIDMF